MEQFQEGSGDFECYSDDKEPRPSVGTFARFLSFSIHDKDFKPFEDDDDEPVNEPKKKKELLWVNTISAIL